MHHIHISVGINRSLLERNAVVPPSVKVPKVGGYPVTPATSGPETD